MVEKFLVWLFQEDLPFARFADQKFLYDWFFCVLFFWEMIFREKIFKFRFRIVFLEIEKWIPFLLDDVFGFFYNYFSGNIPSTQFSASYYPIFQSKNRFTSFRWTNFFSEKLEDKGIENQVPLGCGGWLYFIGKEKMDAGVSS